MGLPRAGIVQCLVIYCPPRGSIMLCCYVHPALTGHWGVHGNLLYDTQANVTQQALLYSLSPVDRDNCRAVDSNRLGTGVNMEF